MLAIIESLQPSDYKLADHNVHVYILHRSPLLFVSLLLIILAM